MSSIKTFARDTSGLCEVGCSNFLNVNSHACEETGHDIDTVVQDENFKPRANIFGTIHTFSNNKALLHTNERLCKSGDIMPYITLDDNALGSIDIETMKCITSRAKGETSIGPMMAIEGHMALRSVINGFSLDIIYKGLYMKHYLTPPSKNVINEWTDGNRNPILHLPYYPCTKNNRTKYRVKIGLLGAL